MSEVQAGTGPWIWLLYLVYLLIVYSFLGLDWPLCVMKYILVSFIISFFRMIQGF